ncbi:hypothetical protein MUP00_10745 [Candidatus Bathyarchaeota archaeon]|nr:hypothetical protein [Candidatus Bathyarchaeota archaeon]
MPFGRRLAALTRPMSGILEWATVRSWALTAVTVLLRAPKVEGVIGVAR